MSRFTLARDFRRIDPKLARIILIEAGPRILPMLAPELASRAVRDLECARRAGLDREPGHEHRREGRGGRRGADRVRDRVSGPRACAPRRSAARSGSSSAAAAASPSARTCASRDTQKCSSPATSRRPATPTAASSRRSRRSPCSRAASVARQIRRDLHGESGPEAFHHVDRGTLATIGRSRAVGQVGRWQVSGAFAWLVWLLVHIYYLVGFKNRLLVVIQWARGRTLRVRCARAADRRRSDVALLRARGD